jgi:nucleoside-diphosphate-sugar epimerase
MNKDIGLTLYTYEMEHKGGDKVCVTGASGFLASWLIKKLLLSGYQVIGTVRDLGLFSSLLHICITFFITYHFNYPNLILLQINICMTHYIFAGKKKKVEHLWKLEGATERLELIQADLMEENSFDNAIMGCKGVFHIASPVLNHISDNPKV